MSNFSFVETSANKQTPEETLMVLVYEVGGVVERWYKAKRYGGVGYVEDMRAKASGVGSMLRMFCEQVGWDFEELLRLGEKRYLERQEDLKKHGIKEV